MSSSALHDLVAAGRQPVSHIDGLDCSIEIAARPAYCDRGNFVATIEVTGDWLRLSIDGADGWPRYYFELDRAKAEVDAWLRKRGQWDESRWREIVP